LAKYESVMLMEFDPDEVVSRFYLPEQGERQGNANRRAKREREREREGERESSCNYDVKTW